MYSAEEHALVVGHPKVRPCISRFERTPLHYRKTLRGSRHSWRKRPSVEVCVRHHRAAGRSAISRVPLLALFASLGNFGLFAMLGISPPVTLWPLTLDISAKLRDSSGNRYCLSPVAWAVEMIIAFCWCCGHVVDTAMITANVSRLCPWIGSPAQSISFWLQRCWLPLTIGSTCWPWYSCFILVASPLFGFAFRSVRSCLLLGACLLTSVHPFTLSCIWTRWIQPQGRYFKERLKTVPSCLSCAFGVMLVFLNLWGLFVDAFTE